MFVISLKEYDLYHPFFYQTSGRNENNFSIFASMFQEDITKNYIYNISELKATLNRELISSHEDILTKIRFGFNEIEHLCFWNSEHYSQVNIGSTGNYELALICWEKEQQLSVRRQSVDLVSCIYLLKGELTRETYNEGYRGSELLLNKERLLPKQTFCLSREENKAIRLTNTFNGRSVSLHVYKKR